MRFYLLWHDRAHHSEECRWFREQIVDVIRESIGSKTQPAAPKAAARQPALA